jgi:ribonuclease-3
MGKGDEAQNAQDQESVKEDLFESIIGAVAIDCGWKVEILEEVIDRMINIEYYLENGFQDDKNYVDLIQTWCQKKYGYLPEYNIYELNDGYECIISFSNEFNGFSGQGYSKREARMNAAREAFAYLDREHKWILPVDEVGEPDKDRAINQLQELYQKGYIGEPWYDFSETYDDNGNPIWRCECHVSGFDTYFCGNYSSKKYGKKAVAYEMLRYILGLDQL